MRVSLSFTTQRTSLRDVHGKLRPPPEARQILGKDFDLPCVLGAHLNVHVLVEHVLPHSRSCLTENAVHRALWEWRASSPFRCKGIMHGGVHTHRTERGNLRTALPSSAVAVTSAPEAVS